MCAKGAHTPGAKLETPITPVGPGVLDDGDLVKELGEVACVGPGNFALTWLARVTVICVVFWTENP